MKEIALHILDIAENSIAAGAGKVTISVLEEDTSGLLSIRIDDNGRGMSKEETGKCLDPFFTSRTIRRRRIGMGIPLFCQHAEMTGGSLNIESSMGVGTTVEAAFHKAHPDRQPLGDLEGIWILLAAANPGIEWELNCSSARGDFSISTSEIRSTLEVDYIRGDQLLTSLKRLIRNNLDELGLS